MYLFGWSLLMSLWHVFPISLQRIHSRTRSVAAREYPQIHPLTRHQPVRSSRHEHVHGPLLAAHPLGYSRVERTRQGTSFSSGLGLAASLDRETAASGTMRVLSAVEKPRHSVPSSIYTPRAFQVQLVWHAAPRSLKRDEPAFVPVQ